jgi:hypothetical protein
MLIDIISSGVGVGVDTEQADEFVDCKLGLARPWTKVVPTPTSPLLLLLLSVTPDR